MASLLRTLGGTAYLLETAAQALVAEGTARYVADAPPIAQPVHSVVHVRRRHIATHRRLLPVLRAAFGGGDRPHA